MTEFSQRDYLQEVRQDMLVQINAAIDAAISNLVMPSDQAAFLADSAMFMNFLVVTKIAAVTRTEPTDRAGMVRHWNVLESEIRKQVPRTLMQFVDASNTGMN